MAERKLTRKIFMFPEGRKEWCVSGGYGSLSFWFQSYPKDFEFGFGRDGYGGVETHYNAKSKPDYIGALAHHTDCVCNGGECWHDGTSLWASEHWIPHIMPNGDEAIFRELEFHYSKLEESSAPDEEQD